MGDVKISTFPHVLKEYNPDYEPYIPLSDAARKRQETQRQSSPPKPVQRQTSVQSQKHHNTVKDISPNRTHSRGAPTGSQSPDQAPSESDRSVRRRTGKTDVERYVELSQKWDQAKQEVRLEDHEHLREKIVLQQELIKAQDQYAEQRRLKIAKEQSQIRESAKAKKLAQEEHLRQICKKSLEEDRKSAGRKANVKGGKDLTLQKRKSPLHDVSGIPSPGRSPTSPGFKRGTPFKMTLPTMPATPIDADLEDPEEEKKMEVPKDALWHEQQLYRLYGRNADYFLHPKMEQQQQVKKMINPKLRRQGGRAGAEALWSTLREDSSLRLLKEDATIPQKLKECYGAFARQSLQRNRMPVRRMFYAEDDLPEMGRLLDRRAITKLRKRQHKTDLMYRASVSNQDRTEVLKYNNPQPGFGESQSLSVDQYLPSWMDEASEGSLPEYYKWVNTQRHAGDLSIHEEEEEEEHEKENYQPQVTQSMDDDLIMILSRRRPMKAKPKYIFLSEKDTTVPGEFSHKYKEGRENKGIPRPYQGDHPKAHSSLDMSDSSPRKTGSSGGCYSAPLPSKQELMRTYTTSWEPLTMHALVEYKKQLSTMGEGDFNLGRTKMWAQIPVV